MFAAWVVEVRAWSFGFGVPGYVWLRVKSIGGCRVPSHIDTAFCLHGLMESMLNSV